MEPALPGARSANAGARLSRLRTRMTQTQMDEFSALYSKVEEHVASGEWDDALGCARAAAAAAERMNDPGAMHKAGGHLERLMDFGFSARLLAAAGRAESGSPLPEWDGSRDDDRTLLVVQRMRDVGAPIRVARLIPLAAKRVKQCIVLAEPRLVPLFRRSMPGVDVRVSGEEDAAALAAADMIASYETLTWRLAPDAKAIVDGFSPLRPDRESVEALRARYRRRADGMPLIGISWYSLARRKEVPQLEDWAAFLNAVPAMFVSVQYGRIRSDLRDLRAMTGSKILWDKSIDAFNDLDGLAAQLASLDAIVSISNTTVHLAGALGVPTIVIIDDRFRLMWPPMHDASPWYPATTLIRRRNRAWADVMADAAAVVADRLRNARSPQESQSLENAH